MNRKVGSFILLLAACSGEPVIQEDTPPLYKYTSLQTAMSDAQATLPVFWTHHANRGEGEDGFRVKVAEPSDQYLRDYVWVEYLQEGTAPGLWSGAVSIEHGGNDRFRTDDRIEFDVGDIVDWAYSDNGKIRGSYTTSAMLDLSGADTTALRARFHESPTP